MRKLNRRQAQWSLYLSEFDIKLVHTPRHKMIQSDALLRQLDFIPDKDTDNEDITMLPDNLFIQLLDIDLQRQIANTHDHDEEVTKALSIMMEQGPHAIRRELGDWTIEKFEDRDIIFFKGKNYIPRDDDLCRDITRLFHDHKMAGHPGELIMLCDNITGGPDYVLVLKTMYVDAVLVNNSKLTDLPLAPLSFLLKGLNRHNRLRIVLWTLHRLATS